MKRIIGLLALAALLITPSMALAGDLTMSITVAQGWKEANRSSDGTITYVPDATPGTYANTFVQLSIQNNYKNLSGRAYVENKIKTEKPYYANNEYSDVGDVTVAGHNAFSYSVFDKNTDIVSSYTFIVKGKDVYVFQSTIMAEHIGKFSNDIDAMYESFTLK